MNNLTWYTIGVIVLYFLLLLIISRLAAKGDNDNATFFLGNRKSPWFLVAFGMIGTTLSGVTFISVPGEVGNKGFAYFQMVLGYILGYAVIALILLPIYYKKQLTSIYQFLNERLGSVAYKFGAFYFLLSRSIGAAFRLYLIALVFHVFIFSPLGVPFWLAVAITLALIWVYTFQSGIKTIVYTDSFQTFFLITAMIASIVFILNDLDLSWTEASSAVNEAGLGKTFFMDWTKGNYFWKQFISGAFIAIVMTGLDQDMMQKNLSCRNLKDAQKNMFSFTAILVIVKFIFLFLGALLALYAASKGLSMPEQTDRLYPTLAFEYFPVGIALLFVTGLTAAAYSSADSALTALTTSFCVDFLGFREDSVSQNQKMRYLVHISFTGVLFLLILFFHNLNDESALSNIFKAAGYTYGPLLGMFSFSIFTKKSSTNVAIVLSVILAPILTYILASNSPDWFEYNFGFEILLVNGVLCFIGLMIGSINFHSEA